MVAERPVVIVSNRGPVSFSIGEDGEPVGRRAAGGLASGLGPLIRGTDTQWIAAAMSDGDRAIAARGVTTAEDFRIRLLDIDADTYDAYYDDVCNEALWFAHHGLFDGVTTPAWPSGWVDRAWAAYRRVNEVFADAVVADSPADAAVLVQDYHLGLLAPRVRAARPDLHLVHFSHTPFAPPAWFRMLPTVARAELVAGLAAHHACGFHTQRWADDFTATCRSEAVEPPITFVAPLGPDADDLAATLDSDACRRSIDELDRLVGDRTFVVRVDRVELSKNLVRGFDAYEQFLIDRPDQHGRVVFGAFAYPSRLGVAAYDRYAREVAERVVAINARFGTADWTPVHYEPDDDYPRSIAALARADVVMVNPIRDGLNLVAKEAMVVNHRQGQLLLSTEAGAYAELAEGAWTVDPFDVGATALTLARCLDARPDERTRRHGLLDAAARRRTPTHWLADQLAAAEPGR